MKQKVTISPVALAIAWQPEAFHLTKLPYAIQTNVAIEDVSQLITNRSFTVFRHSEHLSKDQLNTLEGVRFGLVHRYKIDGPGSRDEAKDRKSIDLVQKLSACLRIIRPTRVRALLMQGELQDWGFDVGHFEHPINLMEIPEAQKLWHVREIDAAALRRLAGTFLDAYTKDIMKFMMSVQFYQAGHFADQPIWKVRFFLWVTALEALFTTPDREHNGKLVSTERIKCFIGARTPIYELGDLTEFEGRPKTTVADVIGDVYKLRNLVAHGSRVPESWFRPDRPGLNGPVPYSQVLTEASSFCVRKSLLRILEDKLLLHFKTARSNEKYFTDLKQRKSDLEKRVGGM